MGIMDEKDEAERVEWFRQAEETSTGSSELSECGLSPADGLRRNNNECGRLLTDG